MANQVDFKILPSDQFSVHSPATRSEKIITYFTLLSKLRGDILAVSSQDDPNNIVSAYYTNVGNTQTLHLVKADGSEVTASNDYAGTVTSVGVSMPSAFTVTNSPITTSGTIQITGAGNDTQYVRGDGTLATFPALTGFVPYVGATQNVDLGEYQIKAGQVAFDLTPTGTAGVGIMRWNDQDGTVDLGLIGGNVNLQIGQEQVVRVVNKSGINLTEAGYQAVKITGAQGNRLKVGLAQGNNDANSADTIGLVTENIALNAEGFVTSSGLVRNIDTTGALQGETWADGDVIYLSPTTAGAVTKIKPTAPQHTVILGFVVRAHATQGQIYVKVDNGYELEELHDVAPTPYVNNGVLYRDTATNLWKSATIPTLLGYTPANAATTISTTAPLSGGGDLSANRTLSISQAGASTDGYLSSTDWNTFNNKASDAFKTIAVAGQSNIVADSAADTLTFEAGSNIVITTDAATDKITITAIGGGSGSVTSVDMSVPTGFAISGNPITTSGTLALAFASGYSLPTTASQANWNTAYNDSITAFSYNTSTGVLTLTQQDAGTLTATVTLQPFTTDNLTQGSTNLYDKVVSLTGAGTTVVTGTYPNFTITSNDQHVGTVTSIATSAPITGGTITTSGTIGITQSGTAADGYLSSTDWNTFNSKVGGSGTINYVSKWTSTGAIGNSQIFDSGTYVGINTATPAAKLDISGDHVASIGLLRLNASAANIAAQTYYIDSVYKGAVYASTDDNFYILGRDADIVFSTTSSATARMTITNGGNVGIGTTSPTQKLMVSGSVRVTGGYYDSSNSIGSNGQVLASTGSGTTWINASGGTVNGSGTVNYLSKWTGTTLLADSQLFDDGTNVGVGTATPNRKLTVSGNGTLLGLQSNTAGGYSEMEFTANSVSAAYIFKLSAGNSSYAGAGSFNIYNSGAIGFHTASVSNAMFIASSTGNIGLGNTGPTQKLHVEGNIRVTGAYYDSANGAGSSGQVLSSTGSGTSWITPFSGSGTTNYVAKWTSGTALGNSQIFDNGTNVGIGTASPAEKLQVNGLVRITNPTYAGIEYHNTNGTWELYVGTESGGSGARYNSASSKHTFYNNSTAVLSIVSSNVGIGTTSPSRLLHVAGNAQVDGWIFQGGYYNGSVTLPYPGANYGNGRIYLRLCSSASGRIMTAKVRISSTWNWAPAFGSVEADISFYWDGSSLVYSYVNILSATGLAATNLTFGALAVEGGSISVPVYSINSNPIYAYIQLSPDADPSQVSYSTWSSVAFPGQSNVYVQTNLGVGTAAPAYKLDVSGNARAAGITLNSFTTGTSGGNLELGFDGTHGVVQAINRSASWIPLYFSGDDVRFNPQGTERVRITSTGSVGIGNTAPSQLLHVSGNVRVTGAYYDSANAAGTSGQILSSTGTGTAWISPGGGGGIITGSGTTNYVTKWTSGTAVGDSSIFDNGNVGIGTAAPTAKLTIGANTVVQSTNGIALGIGQASLELVHATFNNGFGSKFYSVDSGAGITSLRIATRADSTTWSDAVTIIAGTVGNGNVGIGITGPSYKLSVNGDAGIEGSESYLYFHSSATVGSNARARMRAVGAGGGSGYGGDLRIDTRASNNVWNENVVTVSNNGNVGIGETAPSQKLHVSGNIRVTGAYYDSANSAGTSGQILSSTGTGTAWIAAPSGGITGSGTTNYVTKWTSGSAVGNSVMYDNGTNVVIGSTVANPVGSASPAALTLRKFTSGNATTVLSSSYYLGVGGNEYTVNSYRLIGFGYAEVSSTSTYPAYIGYQEKTTSGYTYGDLIFGTRSTVGAGDNPVERMRIDYNGNVGIGTTAPNAKLDVAGGINTRNTRVNPAEKYPVGHYSFGETVFEIDPTWTEAQLQDFFNVSGVSWIADSTAPGGYAIQIDGSVNVGAGEYDSGFPYIPVDSSQDDWYYMECYIRNDAGSSIQHYMGGIDFNQNFSSLGGNPGSYTYNVMFNYNPGTSWTKVYGYWNGFGSSYGSAGTGNTNNWVSGTKYFTPQALFNYGLNSGIRRCYISGWKCVRVRATGNRYYSNNVLVSGNVGIGTTGPETKLQVEQTIAGDAGGMLYLKNSTESSGTYTGIYFGTWGRKSGIFHKQGSYGGYGTGDLIFATNSALNGVVVSPSDARMTITSPGNVGIGTTAPLAKLHVIGSIDTRTNNSVTDTNIVLFNVYNGPPAGDGTTIGTGITWKPLYDGYSKRSAGIMQIAEGNYFRAGLAFYTNGVQNDSTDWSERLRISSNGNVGIGTTSPSFPLSVAGKIGGTLFSDSHLEFLGSGNTILKANNDVVIGYSQSFYVTQGGNVGIGTTSPGYKLDVSGTIRATGDVIAYSDARVKENVETLDGALDKVMKMRGVSYNKIGEQEKKVGVIAQEILEVLPEVVSQDETGTYSVAYGNIVSVLIEAIKEQQKQIDELKSKLK